MPRLLQAQGHLAVLIEGDMKDVFLPGSEISRNGCGLVVSRRIGSYLHLESMFPGRYLHGMEFMPLNVMEYAKTFFVRSFQRMCIGQAVIHPDREMRLCEFVIDLDFERGGCGRRRNVP